MKDNGIVVLIGLALLAAPTVGLVYVLSRMQDELLAQLLTVGVLCISVAILALGLGFGGSLWRKAGHAPRPETKYIMHTKEKIFDGRPQAAPQLLQLPAASGADFPMLLEAAYNSGLGAARAQVRDERGEPTAAGLGDTWDGQAFDEEREEG
jgi:NADH:ubiquinone oxidoreductase subunit K